jgi:hypothetical protein
MPTRPTSVTIFGILNLSFAGLGFLGLLFAVAMLFIKLPAGNPMVDIINENALYGLWLKIGLGLAFIGNLMLLAAGIGLLKLREWGRKLSIAYGILTVLAGIAGTVINCVVLLPVMLDKVHHSHGPEAMGALGGAIGGIFGGCFGMIYPIVLIFFMMRRDVITACRAPMAPPPVPRL